MIPSVEKLPWPRVEWRPPRLARCECLPTALRALRLSSSVAAVAVLLTGPGYARQPSSLPLILFGRRLLHAVLDKNKM